MKLGRVAAAGAALALLTTPIAIAGGAGSPSSGLATFERVASAGGAQEKLVKKVNKLTRKLKALRTRVAELERQPGPAGPEGAQGPEGPPGPASGAAGGDLGGSYPNPEIAANAVGTPELQDAAVTGAKVAPNAIGSPQIAAGAVGESDLASGSVSREKIQSGAIGGSEIGLLAVGSFDLADTDVVTASTSVGPAGGVGSRSVQCPSGQRLFSGGAGFGFASGDISASYPSSEVAWFAMGQNNGTVAQDLTVYAICLVDSTP